MKKLFNIFMVTGVFLWGAAVLLREIGIACVSPAMMLITGVMPNFGAVWCVVGLVLTLFTAFTKKEFPGSRILPLITGVFAFMILSEFAHTWYSDAKIDLLDIAASFAASCILIAVKFAVRPKKTSVKKQ